MGDGGCFRHLDEKGKFINQRSEKEYFNNYCPFPVRDEPPRSHNSDARKREALKQWELKALADSYPPFAINDLAMACLMGNLDDREASIRSKFQTKSSFVPASDKEFCETMLALPLMFDSVGFDGPGLLWEDNRTRTLHSFKGHPITSDDYRKGPLRGCVGIGSYTSGGGDPRHARLALMAMLPTWFRYTYAESRNERNYMGAISLFDPDMFSDQHWEPLVKKVCRNIKDPGWSGFFSLEELEKYRQKKVMDRDRSTCRSATPCNYVANTLEHLGACDICQDVNEPWLEPIDGECYSEDEDDRERCNVAKPERRTCKCHKAVCWYFTGDFQKAMEAAQNVCELPDQRDHLNGQSSGSRQSRQQSALDPGPKSRSRSRSRSGAGAEPKRVAVMASRHQTK